MLRAAMDYRREQKTIRKRIRALAWNRWRNTLIYKEKKHWWQR